jgi:predicted ABC-type ATPase
MKFLLLFLFLTTSNPGFCKSSHELIKEFCEVEISKIPSQKNPQVLYFAGLPGAGKSTIKRALNDLGLIKFSSYQSIDSDEFLVQLDDYITLSKQGKLIDAVNKNQKPATDIREAAVECSKKKKINFIFDTTLGGQSAMDGLHNIANQGYLPWILYVEIEGNVALGRIKDREKTEGRTVDEGYFHAMVKKVPINIETLKNSNKFLVITVDNTALVPVLKSIKFPNKADLKYSIPLNKQNLFKLQEVFKEVSKNISQENK